MAAGRRKWDNWDMAHIFRNFRCSFVAAYVFRYILPPLAWAGLIFYLSGIPGLKTPFSWDYILRKLAHMFEYAVLCALVARAFAGAGLTGRRQVGYAVILAVLYAVTDEYHQSFVPGRFCSPMDVLIDAVGAAAGYYGFLLLRRRKCIK